MAEDKPLPVELPAPALKQAQRRMLWVQAASDRFGALVITHQANPGMTHFHVRRDKAALFQRVQAPPGGRSSRKHPGQAWRRRNV
jgi:hypothetical protein